MSWKKIVASVAPTIGTALGGPFVGSAVSRISKVLLGHSNGTEKEVAEAVLKADPDTLLKLKEADNDYKVEMKKLDVDLEKVHSSDRDSARDRQEKMKDWTPSVLGALIVIGFFSVLAALMVVTVPKGSEAVLHIMLGALGTMTASVVNYFYGSSSGSAKKNYLLAKAK